MRYPEAIEYLMSFADFERSGRFDARTDLAVAQALMAALGDPQRGRSTVHVAGSNGKGSVCAMVSSILRAAGLRVGLFTSPHLHSFRERIRIDGEPVSQETFASLADALPPAVDAVRARHPDRALVTFDLLTAMAFTAFRDAAVDVQVIETGLGGRLDPTNVLAEKDVCVITPISLEHTAILGDTPAQIASEKAGIIAPASTVVIGRQDEAALAVIRQACAERGARPVESAEACSVGRVTTGREGQRFDLTTPEGTYRVSMPLLGRHQVENAATAVLAVEALRPRCDVSAEAIARGLREVRWPGRLEIIRREPLVVVDGAHNPDGARRLRECLEELGVKGATLVVGCSTGKDAQSMARELRPVAARVIATRSRHPRSMAPEEVAAAFAALGVPVSTAPHVAAAIDEALASSRPDGAFCILGSLFVAAEAREHLLGIEPEQF